MIDLRLRQGRKDQGEANEPSLSVCFNQRSKKNTLYPTRIDCSLRIPPLPPT
jgi:hypothetical protein